MILWWIAKERTQKLTNSKTFRIFADEKKNYHIMNVKFKMPKFGRVLTGKGFLKELGLTILATTISIILTFGTAHLIEQKQKKNAGRQTAMMVIHDIDENVQLMRDKAKLEVDNFELAQYVLSHLDSINTISFDTLNTVLDFISRMEDFKMQDSKEKIFHSSPDSWKNIDNPQFIDVAQSFFYERRYYQDIFNSDYRFIEPFDKEQQYQMYLEHAPTYNILDFLPEFLKGKLQDNKVQFFLMYSPMRSRTYNAIADEWNQMSDQCKFIMGITDEEMEEYVKATKRFGRPVRKGDVIGKWTAASSKDKTEEMEFMRDQTFTHTITLKVVNPFYSGRLLFVTTIGGTWTIEGDSLVRCYNSDIKVISDKSQMTCKPEMKDSVDSYISNNERMNKEQWEKDMNNPILSHFATSAYIDDSRDKLELGKTQTNDEGKETFVATYMTRVKK